MKNGKRPTVAQKKLMAAWGFNSAEWLVAKDTPEAMTIVNRKNKDQSQVITKEGK